MNNTPEKALAYALLLLKYRLRSESELRERLGKKKFSPDIIDAAIRLLREKEFIDDGVFARKWFAYRMRQSCGIRRIQRELREKGVDARVVAQAHKDAGEYDELAAARLLVKKRMRLMAGIETNKVKQRLFGFLARRGFSAEIIEEALEEAVK